METINQNVISSKLQDEFDVGGSVQIRHGSSVDLRCPATGIPPPLIEWWLNDAKVSATRNRLDFIFSDDNDRILSIPYADKKHTGTYRCIAKSYDGGVSEATIQVSVYGMSSIFNHNYFFLFICVYPSNNRKGWGKK